ncbi:MAG: hypothetical protein A2032_07510 [Chloroflexi bacterium RBG_19FT_COMBO_49_13]|nr:MAG: hypothetical protein A2032_07510 [Chloroflexi bacterium RBG_19FT_COMBO_49_13]
MHPMPAKMLAVLMICVTVIGLLLSVFFIIQIWRYRPTLTDELTSAVNQTSMILETTGEGLDVIDQVVRNVYSSTLYLDDTTTTLVQTILNTDTFIDSASTFMGEDLINTITNTQQTLDTAQSSALVIDNVLTTLSRIPLIGISYNPTLPLNEALGEVSASLDPLRISLLTFQVDLMAIQLNIKDFNRQILILDQNINAINKNLKSSQGVIDNYQTQVESMQSWVKEAKISLPKGITTACWIITVIILWLVLIQLSVLLQGIIQLSQAGNKKETVNEQ